MSAIRKLCADDCEFGEDVYHMNITQISLRVL